MRLSIKHILAQNKQKTAVKNRRCIFTVNIGPLHNYGNYCSPSCGKIEVSDYSSEIWVNLR